MRLTKFLRNIVIVLGTVLPMQAVAGELAVVIVTEIRNIGGAVQLGVKSRQRIRIDFDARRVTSSFETGVTDLGVVTLEAVRNRFKVEAVNFTASGVTFRAVGQTASGVLLLGDIDYTFTLTIDRQARSAAITGCHDEFPSYAISIEGRSAYDRPQTGNPITGLPGTCAIQVRTTAGF